MTSPAVSDKNIEGPKIVMTGLILLITEEGECLGTAIMALEVIPSQAGKVIPAREAVVGLGHPLPVGVLRIDKSMSILMMPRSATTVEN